MLLRTNHSSEFEFQGRTAPAVNSNATVFSVFALKESNDTIEVMYACTCVQFYFKMSLMFPDPFHQ